MRDDNRLKEKIELRLDRRQVTSLSVVALLLSSAVFALGVMVGRNLAPVQRSALPEEALLDRLDAAVALDGGEGETLTFEDELTKKLPKPSAPLAGLARPKPLPVAVATSLPSKDAQTPSPPPASLKPLPPGAAATTPAPSATAKLLAHVAPTSFDSGVEVSVAAKVPLPAPIKPFFTVQVKATQSPNEADGFAKKLRAEGYQALVAEADVPGKGRWYRVRVGKFENRPQAERYLADFKRETHVEAFVTAAGH